jgi:UDP-2,3-diacylglucosamine hydrolase
METVFIPDIVHYHCPTHWQAIDFISDLHLSESTPKTLATLKNYLNQTTSDAVFILGDLFDVWVGDDASLHGFEAECTALLKTVGQHLNMGFMRGNRDFLLANQMVETCNFIDLPDPCCIHAFLTEVLCSHGDMLCLEETAYQTFRQKVRSSEWQLHFLSQTLADRYAVAKKIRQASEFLKAKLNYADWVDIDAVTAQLWMQAVGTSHFIHGHTHRPQDEIWNQDPLQMRHVLSDWDMEDVDYPRAQILRWTCAGLQRINL